MIEFLSLHHCLCLAIKLKANLKSTKGSYSTEPGLKIYCSTRCCFFIVYLFMVSIQQYTAAIKIWDICRKQHVSEILFVELNSTINELMYGHISKIAIKEIINYC